MKVVCLYFQEAQDTHSIAEVFYRATPQIMLRGDRAIFLEIGKCRNLYSEDSFMKRTKITLEKLNLKASIGVAHDIPTALSFAVYGQQEVLQLPIEALKFYADPLGDQDEIVKNVSKMILVLKDLGLRSLKDFSRLSRSELSARFSSLGLMCSLRIQGLNEILWKPFVLSEVLFETCEFDLESPVDNLEPIFFRLKPMIEKLSLRLRSKGRRLKKFEIVLQQEHALRPQERLRIFEVLLQLPYVSHKIIFQIAKEKIEAMVQAQPLKARISEFKAVVIEDVVYTMNQKSLFNQKAEETQENFFHVVSRIATKLGEKAAFFAEPQESYLPERNWSRSSEPKQKKIQDPLPERPLRVFHYAKPVQYMGRKIFSQDFSEEVDYWSDKEVVFSDWWNNSLERVYYRVFTKTGRHLWLYRTARGDFLHGEFD
jgi:hypothetical protein